MLAKRIADAPAMWISIPMWGRVFTAYRKLLRLSIGEAMTVTQESAVLIGGRWTPSVDGQTVPVISPATEEPVAHVTLGGAQDMEARDPRRPRGVRRGPVAADVPARARAGARACERAADGAPRRARGDASRRRSARRSSRRCARACTNVRDMFDVHVAMAETYPWVEIRDGMRSQVEIRQEPVGVVGAIVPWNVPFSLTSAKLAPALARRAARSCSSPPRRRRSTRSRCRRSSPRPACPTACSASSRPTATSARRS